MRRFNKVLITGASGQLGRRLVREMLARGYNIRAHYRSPEKAEKYCPYGAEHVFGDMAVSGWLDEAVTGCDCVIHCAAWVSVRPLNKERAHYMYRVNVEGTRQVIEACKKAGVKRLVHVSSIAGLGASKNDGPIDETASFNLGDFGYPYFDTKYESDVLALESNSDKLETVVVNPSIMISPPDREITKKDLKKIPRRIPAYFEFGLNLVETADVIKGMLGALEKGRPGQRYLLTGEDINPEKVFAIGKKYFNIKKPWLKIPLPVLSFLGLLAEAYYLFKGTKPKLNRKIGKLAKLKFYYSYQKAQRELGYNPRPLEQTVKNILDKINH